MKKLIRITEESKLILSIEAAKLGITLTQIIADILDKTARDFKKDNPDRYL